MRQRRFVAVLGIAVVVLVGVALWLFVQPTTTSVDSKTTTEKVAVGTAATDATKKKAAKSAAARKWERVGTGTVVGVVREYGTERPLAGVEVTLEAGLPGPNETLHAATRADGGFTFASVANFDAWTLRAKAPAPLADAALAGVGVVENRETNLGVVYLAPDFGVPGTVVDEKDGPIAGALVRAVRARTGGSAMDILRLIRELPSRPTAVDSATSAVDGKFELRKVPPGRYDFIVEKTGYQLKVAASEIVNPDAKSRPLKFVLVRGFQLDGKVVRPGGGPVVGIAVVAFHQPNGDRDFNVLDKCFAATDDKGAFKIDGLGAGRYVVAAMPEGEPAVAADDVVVPAKKPVEIVLSGDAWLEGKITGDGDKPVSGAQVYAMRFDGGSPIVGNAKSDGEGRYVLHGLKSGPLQMFLVQAEGFGNYPEDVMKLMNGGGASEVKLVPGRNEKNVSLAKGGVVRGVVQEKDGGAPIPGARVQLGTMLAIFGGSRETTSGADGRFEITSVPKGTAVLMVDKEGWFQPGVNAQSVMMVMGSRMQGGGGSAKDSGKGATIVISDPGQVVERTVELAHGSSLAGTVTSPDGQPVAGAQVSLVLEDSGNGMMGMVAGLFPTPEPRLTDSQGLYQIPGPPPGQKARVVARAAGWLDGRSDAVSCSPGDAKTGVDVKLRQGATLRGRVHDEQGKSIDGAVVRWVAVGGDGSNGGVVDAQDWSIQWRLRSAPPTLTDSDGRFRIPNVETGKLVVEATDARHLPWIARDVQTEEGKPTDVDATLKLGATLDGRVLGVDGGPRSGASVSWSKKSAEGEAYDPLQDNSGSTLTDSGGAFHLEGLAPGAYELTARAEGAAPSDPQTASAGGQVVTLQLAQAFTVTGFVKTKDGAAVAEADVQLVKRTITPKDGGGTDESTREVESAQTGAAGDFELKNVPAGTYELHVGSSGWRPGTRPNFVATTVKDVPAGKQGLVVEVEPGLTIAGTIFGEDGQPAGDGYVWANRVDPTPGGNDWVNAQIDAGKFELVGLTAGKYHVNVNAGGRRKTIVVEAGTSDARIEFAGGGSVRVHVTSDSGAASGAWVSASNESGGGQAMTDANGDCEIKSLAEGSYSVQASLRSGETFLHAQQDGVQVRSSGAVDVSLALAKPQQK